MIRSNSLLMGNTRSCGCLQKTIAKRSCKERSKHNACYTKPYKSWAHMKDRCNNVNAADYKNYGGRGISICNKWLTFEGFWDDMGTSYTKGTTIDRIDNNGDYVPSNCRWASKIVQNNNKRNNRVISYQGIEQTMADWARYLGINYKTLANRLACGWSVEKAFKTTVRRCGGNRI